MTVITTIEDLRVLARRRVPKMFYDYADSGSWTESTYRANESDFQGILLRQRVAVNMENRSTAVTMAGQAATMPVAIAPVGLTGSMPTVRSSRRARRSCSASHSRCPR
jgi:L-lactate dehydrogenase (cytochrome)